MTAKIEKKIVDYKVVTPELRAEAERARNAAQEKLDNAVQKMDENIDRPETLHGTTYKIKTPLTDHALYITINDIILNPGTDHQQRRPFEVFINSKNMDHFQWVVALTRVLSAVFRKGGDCTFLVEEMKAVFDPKGGYFKKGGKFMPSLVAEIGDCLETHMKSIGLIEDPEISDHQRRIMEEKRAEFEGKSASAKAEGEVSPYPPGAQLCNKCMTKAMIMMDGCMTCLNCGESKCG
ncbi:MAG: NrdJb [Porticoccaceae bacterium]|nr:NrdJb [Porticoccaceae bacterium]